MSDDPTYAEYDAVDFIEADEGTRAELLEEFEPTGGPECDAIHIIAPPKETDIPYNRTSYCEQNTTSDV